MGVCKNYKNIFYGFFLLCLLVLGFSFASFAGSWQQDGRGWRYVKEDGSHPKNEWMWVDGNSDGYAECYYFDSDGYCLINTTTPDGYPVNADGAWTVNGAVQRTITVTGTLGYYNKRAGLAKYYAGDSGKIILSMYPDNVQFAVLTLAQPRDFAVTDGNTEEEYTDKVTQIHFSSKSENIGNGRESTSPSWIEYQNKKVTIVFLEAKPRLWNNATGGPLDAVTYDENNIRIYAN